jgi:DNA polymerase III alpha subunit (gram-positive type)
MSRKHRHRDHKVKKMHTIIGEYAKMLDDIGTIPEVQSVITGVISPHKSEHEEMTFQYFTDQGLKLLAKTTEAVQEVFVVTDQKQRVLEELYSRGLLQERMKKPTTLKDLLSPEMLAMLQNASSELKEQERVAQEKKRKAEMERREKEQKELENQFEYLLNHSKLDWREFK